MKASSFRYLLKEGFRGFWVNRLMSLASIGVLVACMLLIGAAVLASININSMVGYVEDQNEMVVFVKEDVSDSEVKEVEKALNQVDNLSEVVFVSKEAALEETLKSVGEQDEFFEDLKDQNPMPFSFKVKVQDLERLSETQREVEQVAGVDYARAPTEIAGTLTTIERIVYVAGVAIVGILLVVSMIIISNTIKITVFNRRKEINIMKYVGATDGFIRMPFLVEGIILGLISAILSFFLLWGGYTLLINYIGSAPLSSQWIREVFMSVVPFTTVAKELAIGFGVGGVGLGALGSLIFVRKYLKV
ncbi:permease-like cell division protein FtsX [Zongyangia hominis]|uniref:Cell division protein FtsX n=1 Tax=Zongyangia hominis TaxID=2763677 RepID=A0A926EFA7_9FIRM|nr:permease-like cell division protein FtsX [Zongyangia hominis]MBC8571011.1 ABC transporter permease [Zongyangia hominis]